MARDDRKAEALYIQTCTCNCLLPQLGDIGESELKHQTEPRSGPHKKCSPSVKPQEKLDESILQNHCFASCLVCIELLL